VSKAETANPNRVMMATTGGNPTPKSLLDYMKNSVSGDCVVHDAATVGLLLGAVANKVDGAWWVAQKGDVGPTCHVMCADPHTKGQACVGLLSPGGKHELLSDSAASIVEECGGSTIPDSCWEGTLFYSRKADLCSLADAACDTKETSAEPCTDKTIPICKICWSPIIPPAGADGMSSYSVGGATVKGTPAFLKQLVEMLKKIDDDNTDGCNVLPAGCSIQRSYDSGDVNSPHGHGVALDICCSGTPDPNSCNMQNVSDMIGRISGFNVIRECTNLEKSAACGNTSKCSGGMVHIDSKYSGDGYGNPRPNPPGKNCLFLNCSWDCNNPIQ